MPLYNLYWLVRRSRHERRRLAILVYLVGFGGFALCMGGVMAVVWLFAADLAPTLAGP